MLGLKKPTPVPGRRVVERIPVAGETQPWPDPETRFIGGSWRGPVHFRVQGVEFNIRYLGLHEHRRIGRYPYHMHPYSEFHYTMRGSGTIHVPDRKLDIHCTPGDLVLLPPSLPHATSWSLTGDEEWRVFVADFDLALDLGQIMESAGETVDVAFSPFYEWFFVRENVSARMDGNEREAVDPIIKEMAATLAVPNYGVGADVVAGLIRVVSLFSRHLRRTGKADGEHIAPPLLSKETVLLRARALLEQSEMLDTGCVERIAHTVGMSKSHFIREFKRSYEITPKQYSLYVLMRRATALLTRSDITVKDVAFSLGYDEPSSFTRAFTKYFGLSPSEYQRRTAKEA